MHPLSKLLFLICTLCCTANIHAQRAGASADVYTLDSLHLLSQLPHRSFATPLAWPSLNSHLLKQSAARPVSLSRAARLQQATCYDTASRFRLSIDSTVLYSQNPLLLADGHVLLYGEYASWKQGYIYKGFVMKVDREGNTVWLRLHDSTGQSQTKHYLFYQKALELQDGSILLVGRSGAGNNQNDHIIFTKTDAQGRVTWSRLYKSRLWTPGNGSADYWVPHELKQDPATGAVFISSAFWNSGKSLLKLDPANGQVLWSRTYDPYSYAIFDRPMGLDIRNNEIRYFGKFSGYSQGVVSVYRISKETGDTLQTLFFKSQDAEGIKLDFLGNEPLTILQNGNYALSGKTYGQYQYMYNGVNPLYQAAVLELSPDLKPVRAYAFRNKIESNGYSSRVTVFPDGSALFAMLKYYSGFVADMYYVQTRDGQIVRQRKKQHVGDGFPYEPSALRFPDGGDVIVRRLGDSIAGGNHIEFLKMYTSDTASQCIGYDDEATSIYPFTYSSMSWGLQSIQRDVVTENGAIALFGSDEKPQRAPGCFTVAYCDTLKLLTDTSAICLSQPLRLTVRKNKACGSLVPLRLDTTAVSSVLQLNDSTYSIRFRRAWSGFIAGSVQGCTLIWDSVFIRVLETPATLELGPDRTLCAGNTLLLNARRGYATYRWQDDSMDSTFTVSAPGIYHVTTSDACGGVYTDTIRIAAAPPVMLNAGNDRAICHSDTLHLTAPTGFINYSWSASDPNIALNGRNVVVRPLTLTYYYLKAEQTPGCFGFDTLRVSVFQPPLIQLGPDKSFCTGDSAVFDAGSGFRSYAWSTGETVPRIRVTQPGRYSVKGTTAEGCHSYDTVTVTQVFPLPRVTLEKDSTLCAGSSRTLDAGLFASYIWNTGATSQSIRVSTPGKYTVNVTDERGCRNGDSVSISKLNALPAGFLPADTALCSYSTLSVKPNREFSKYNWSNGSIQRQINVEKPGTYWLEVMDENRCTGKDTIVITPIPDCMKGLYVPSAFTPNGDGRNDVFRALLFGNIRSFRLQVYNRWGEVVFQTTDPMQGWNGQLKNQGQGNETFAWVCSYQLEGEAARTEKGTVVLVR